MKFSLLNHRWSVLFFILVSFPVHSVRSDWPLSDNCSIQLFGLFPDEVNTTDPTELSVHSRAMFKAAVILSRQYNITINGQSIGWETGQTGGNAIDAVSISCQSISDYNIVGIVGPAFSREVNIIANFGLKIGIPVISYAATAPDLSDRNEYRAFYRTVPSDNSAAQSIVKLFIRFNWTSCLIIYQNDAYGFGGLKIINEAFINNGLIVKDTVVFNIVTRTFRNDLRNTLTNSSTRIILLWAFSSFTELILQKAIDLDVVGPQFTWILSSSISLDSFNKSSYPKLMGMLTVEPIIAGAVNEPLNATLLNGAYDLWKQYEPSTFPGSSKVNSYALFSFDATWLLIQSLQKVCPDNFSSCIIYSNCSSCFNRYLMNSNSLFDRLNNEIFIGVSGFIEFNNNTTDRINGSYYFTQNCQISSSGIHFVPVLDYSDRDGWQRYSGASLIIWPGNSFGYCKSKWCTFKN